MRPLPIDEIPLEVLRDVDGGDGVTGADVVHRAGHVAGSLRNAHAGSRRDRLHIGQRRWRAVGVDDADSKVSDDRITEGRRQDGDGDKGHADREDHCDAVAPHPTQLAQGDKSDAGLCGRSHHRLSGQTA